MTQVNELEVNQMKKGWWWIIAVVIVLVAVGAFVLRRQQATSVDTLILREAQVQRGTLEITIAAGGNVAAEQKSTLRFEVGGTVAEVPVAVGDRVHEGDLLVSLEATDLQRSVEQAQLSLEKAKLRLQQLQEPVTEEDIRKAEHRVSEAYRSYQAAKLNYTAVLSSSILNEDLQAAEDRFRDAQTQYGVAEQQFQEGKIGDAMRDRYRQAADDAYWAWVRLKQEAELKKTEAANQLQQAWDAYIEAKDALESLQEGVSEEDLRSAELDVQAAQLSLEQAEDNLDRAELRAPFDGIVAAVNLHVGDQISAGTPAVTLVDDSRYYVEVTVDETDIGKLAVGQEVEVLLDAYPDLVLKGEIESISPAAEDTSGLVSYPVRVRIEPSEDVAIRDGMTANITIYAQKLEDVLMVPNWAVRSDTEHGTYVFVLEEGMPRRRPVTIGAYNENFTQILDGLEEGETVVLLNEEHNLFQMGGPPRGGTSRRGG